MSIFTTLSSPEVQPFLVGSPRDNLGTVERWAAQESALLDLVRRDGWVREDQVPEQPTMVFDDASSVGRPTPKRLVIKGPGAAERLHGRGVLLLVRPHRCRLARYVLAGDAERAARQGQDV